MKHLTYLSLGAGVQSTALLVMSAKGLMGCPRADVAIFADTGDEPQWVYDHLDWCSKFGVEHGIPLSTVRQGGGLSMDFYAARQGGRFASIPMFTEGEDGRPGILRRQCTNEYKLKPIRAEVRRIVGLRRGERAKGKVHVSALLGISIDESIRMKPSRDAYVTHVYPLIEANMNRADCLALCEEHGAPKPRKSSCVFCPYHSDAFWQDLKDNHPDEFAKAVRFDELIRESTQKGHSRPAFLHRSLKPLREVDFLRWRDTPGQGHLFELDGFGNECEGMCGV